MDAPPDGPYSRTPELEDVARLCRRLNEEGARYALIGGFAVILHGYVRGTKDIDLLVEASATNLQALKRALGDLEDKAILEVTDEDLERYKVVRVADEIVVDLMTQACGIDLATATPELELHQILSVTVPVPSKRLLIRMKDTFRPSDAADVRFLRLRIEEEESQRER